MEIPQDGTFCQWVMPLEYYIGNLQVQGPDIMALKLKDMYTQLGFSLKAAKLLIRKQGLDIPDRLRVLTDKNVDDI